MAASKHCHISPLPWYRTDRGFARHPDVIRLAVASKVSRHEAIGCIEDIWSNLCEHAPTGDLASIPDAVIETWADWKGAPGELVVGLIDSGWLNEKRQFAGWWKRQRQFHEKREAMQEYRKEQKQKRLDAERIKGNGGITVPPPLLHGGITVGDAERSGAMRTDEKKEEAASRPPPPPSSLFEESGEQDSSKSEQKKPEPTPEAKALEADVRDFEEIFREEFTKIVGVAPKLKKAERFMLRALMEEHGRDSVETAAESMFRDFEEGTLKWSGKTCSPEIRRLNATFSDFIVEAQRARG